MKKFFFLIFLIFIFFIFIFLLSFISRKFIINNYGTKYSKETLIIYKKYYKTLNHLRSPWFFDSKNLIYTVIGEGDESIIFQGDSWSEELTHEKYKKKLKKFSKEHNLKLYLSGVSSYSPSLYNAQLDLLISEFNIKPKQIIVFFDHSDIGDELCRYKNSIKKIDGKHIVQPFVKSDEQQIFYLDNTFKRLKILVSDEYNLLKLIKLSWLKIVDMLNNRGIKKCSSDKILSFLEIGISSSEKEYLIKILKRYFENILNIKELERLLIVTHPHKKHLTNDYVFKIDDLIESTLTQIPKDTRVSILDFENFTKSYTKNNDLNMIFIHNDKFSHLSEEYYNKHYLQNILNEISIRQKYNLNK